MCVTPKAGSVLLASPRPFPASARVNPSSLAALPPGEWKLLLSTSLPNLPQASLACFVYQLEMIYWVGLAALLTAQAHNPQEAVHRDDRHVFTAQMEPEWPIAPSVTWRRKVSGQTRFNPGDPQTHTLNLFQEACDWPLGPGKAKRPRPGQDNTGNCTTRENLPEAAGISCAV